MVLKCGQKMTKQKERKKEKKKKRKIPWEEIKKTNYTVRLNDYIRMLFECIFKYINYQIMNQFLKR